MTILETVRRLAQHNAQKLRKFTHCFLTKGDFSMACPRMLSYPLIGPVFASDPIFECVFVSNKKMMKVLKESDLKIDIQTSISSIYTYWKVITVEYSFQLKDFPVECLFLGDGLTRWCLETIMGTRPRNPPKIG